MPSIPVWYADCPYPWRKPQQTAISEVLSNRKKVPPDRIMVMKINVMKASVVALFFLCALCATTASAQTASVLTNNPQPMQMTDHVLHASQHAMAPESSLLGSTSYGYAQGEVPLAELASPIYETPLGDIARANRKEHAAVPKAAKVLEKQF
jgi:hypothetical protein